MADPTMDAPPYRPLAGSDAAAVWEIAEADPTADGSMGETYCVHCLECADVVRRGYPTESSYALNHDPTCRWVRVRRLCGMTLPFTFADQRWMEHRCDTAATT